MVGNFEKTNLDWHIQQVVTQVEETIEFWFQSVDGVNPPNWVLPDEFFRGLFWLLVVLLASWCLWQLYQILRPYWGTIRFTQQGQASQPRPPEPLLSETEWLTRSQSLAHEGNYREACRALYQAMLQKLDRMGVLSAQLSRTDGEYFKGVQRLPNPRPYQLLIQVHERLCFSDAPITREIFRQCEQAYQELIPS